MKSVIIYSLGFTMVLLFISCEGENGVNGANGQAYLNVTANYGVLYSYIDNNTSRGSVFDLGRTYKVLPGTYSFYYESRIYDPNGTYYYAQWNGNYNVHINSGEKGGEGKIFWQKGADGRNGVDSYLTLLCNYDGPNQTRLNKNNNYLSPIISDSIYRIENDFGDYKLEVTYKLNNSGIKHAK